MEGPEDKKPSPYTGLIFLALVLPVLIFFTYLGKTDMGLTAGVCLGMTLFAIRIYWGELRTQIWFWAVVLSLLALHVPLVLKVQWPHQWVPGIVLLPIAVADLMIYVGVIKFVKKFIVKSP